MEEQYKNQQHPISKNMPKKYISRMQLDVTKEEISEALNALGLLDIQLLNINTALYYTYY